jgi:hypothetical protein
MISTTQRIPFLSRHATCTQVHDEQSFSLRSRLVTVCLQCSIIALLTESDWLISEGITVATLEFEILSDAENAEETIALQGFPVYPKNFICYKNASEWPIYVL